MRNKQAIFFLFLANSISGCAQGISMIAIPWYFNAVLGLGKPYGIFLSLVTFGSLFWAFYNGTLIDKYDRKKIFQGISIVGSFVLISAALLGHSFPSLYWLFAGIVFLTTQFIYNIHYPNLYAFAQEMSPPEAYTKITSYIEIQGQATTVIGGALAGILLEGSHNGVMNISGFNLHLGFDMKAWDLWEIFLLDGLTYVAGFFIIGLIRYTPTSERKRDDAPLMERLRFGINYLRKHPVILVFGWASLAVFITIIVNTYYLMPNYIKLHLNAGSSTYAGSELWFAMGAMSAGIFARYIFSSWHEGKKVIGLSFMAASVYVLFMFNKNMGLFYLANYVLGLSNAAVRIYRISYIFRIVPNYVIGRVNGILNLSSYLFRMLMTLIFSLAFLNTADGIVYVMAILALFVMFAAAIMIRIYKNLRNSEAILAMNAD